MSVDSAEPLTVAQRRRAMRLAYWNGAIWAVGKGLASMPLVVFLARELGAKQLGLGIGMILAAPSIVGLLQLGAPAVIGRLVDRKRFCIGAFFLGTCTFLALPWLAAPGRLSTLAKSLAMLVAL